MMINLAKLFITEDIAVKQVVFFELDFSTNAYFKLYLYLPNISILTGLYFIHFSDHPQVQGYSAGLLQQGPLVFAGHSGSMQRRPSEVCLLTSVMFNVVVSSQVNS